MTAKLLAAFKRKITEWKLVPDKGGCFELSLDGELVWSKLAKGSFPDEGAMVELVRKLLEA